MKSLTFRDCLEFLLIPIFGYCASTINDLSKNVAALNTNVAVILTQSMAEKERVNTLDRRIEKIEERFARKEK